MTATKLEVANTFEFDKWPSILQAASRYGEGAPGAIISAVMGTLNKAIGKRLTNDQLKDMGDLIIATWSNRSVAFIMLAIDNGINGRYGKVTWGDINYTMVADWMNHLVNEQEEYSYNLHQSRKNA